MTDSTVSQLSFYARFAADVYDPGRGNDLLSLGDFERPPEKTLDEGHFYGSIYRNVSKDAFVVALRGTDNGGDYPSAINMAAGGALGDPQFASTVALVKQALKLAGWTGNPVDPNDPASVFGWTPSKDMDVIDSNKIEHDVVRKPVPTFRHHAL